MAVYRAHTDEVLISLLQSGDSAALHELYERYWDKLFVTATMRLNNAQEAEDIVQDIMLRLWNNRTRIHIESSLNNYLATAVKYEVINRLAKLKRQQQYQQQSGITEADHTTTEMLDFYALQQRLSELVKALPEKCRMVFTLSREHGLSQKEIAEQMNISENTVESHMKKAIKSLRGKLKLLLLELFW